MAAALKTNVMGLQKELEALITSNQIQVLFGILDQLTSFFAFHGLEKWTHTPDTLVVTGEHCFLLVFLAVFIWLFLEKAWMEDTMSIGSSGCIHQDVHGGKIYALLRHGLHSSLNFLC